MKEGLQAHARASGGVPRYSHISGGRVGSDHARGAGNKVADALPPESRLPLPLAGKLIAAQRLIQDALLPVRAVLEALTQHPGDVAVEARNRTHDPGGSRVNPYLCFHGALPPSEG